MVAGSGLWIPDQNVGGLSDVPNLDNHLDCSIRGTHLKCSEISYRHLQIVKRFLMKTIIFVQKVRLDRVFLVGGDL